MKRRLKRKSNIRKFAIVIGVGILLLFIVGLNLNYLKRMQAEYKVRINAIIREYKLKEVKVYQAKENIQAGSALTFDNVMEKTVVSDLNSEYYMTSENIGNVTLVDIKEGTWIYKDILRKNSLPDNVREVEYSTFFIGNNIKENNYFDLHIQYPNGEDYIVLSKGLIKRMDETNQLLYLWLTPQELFNISGAIVDCYLNQGARLYSVRYVEPTIQQESILTFTPNQDIIQLMKKDPNIINTAIQGLEEQERTDLEERLQLFYSRHETYEVDDQDKIYYAAKNENRIGESVKESNSVSSQKSDGSVSNGNEIRGNTLKDDVTYEGEATEEEVYYVD